MLAPKHSTELNRLPQSTYSASFRSIYHTVLRKLENREVTRRSTTTDAARATRAEVTSKLPVALGRADGNGEVVREPQTYRQQTELPAIYRLRKQRKFEREIEEILRRVAQTPVQGDRKGRGRGSLSRAKTGRGSKENEDNEVGALEPWSSYD